MADNKTGLPLKLGLKVETYPILKNLSKVIDLEYSFIINTEWEKTVYFATKYDKPANSKKIKQDKEPKSKDKNSKKGDKDKENEIIAKQKEAEDPTKPPNFKGFLYVALPLQFFELLNNLNKCTAEAPLNLIRLISYRHPGDVIEFTLKNNINLIDAAESTVFSKDNAYETSRDRGASEVAEDFLSMNGLFSNSVMTIDFDLEHKKTGDKWELIDASVKAWTNQPINIKEVTISKIIRVLGWVNREDSRVKYLEGLEKPFPEGFEKNFEIKLDEFWDATGFGEIQRLCLISLIQSVQRQLKWPKARVPRSPNPYLYSKTSFAGKGAFLTGLLSPFPPSFVDEIEGSAVTDDWSLRPLSDKAVLIVNEADGINSDKGAARMKRMTSGDGRIMMRMMRTEKAETVRMMPRFALTSNIPITNATWIQHGGVTADHIMPVPVTKDLRDVLNLKGVEFHDHKHKLVEGQNKFDCGEFFKNLHWYIYQKHVKPHLKEKHYPTLVMEAKYNKLRLEAFNILQRPKSIESFISDRCVSLGFKNGEIIPKGYSTEGGEEPLQWKTLKALKSDSDLLRLTKKTIEDSRLVVNKKDFNKGGAKADTNYINWCRIGSTQGYRLTKAFVLPDAPQTLRYEEIHGNKPLKEKDECNHAHNPEQHCMAEANNEQPKFKLYVNMNTKECRVDGTNTDQDCDDCYKHYHLRDPEEIKSKLEPNNLNKVGKQQWDKYNRENKAKAAPESLPDDGIVWKGGESEFKKCEAERCLTQGDDDLSDYHDDEQRRVYKVCKDCKKRLSKAEAPDVDDVRDIFK